MSYIGGVAASASEDRLQPGANKEAIDCALATQRAAADCNRGREEAEHVLLCVGPGYGEVLRIGDRDVSGAEAAHRLRCPQGSAASR